MQSQKVVCVCVCRGGLTDVSWGGVKDNPHISDSDASVKKGQLLHFAHKCKRSHLALFLGGEGGLQSSIRGKANFLNVDILHIFLFLKTTNTKSTLGPFKVHLS